MEDLKAEIAAAIMSNDKERLIKLKEKLAAKKWLKNNKSIKDLLKPNPFIKFK